MRLAFLAFALLGGAPILAQKPPEPPPQVDPYTQADPARMQRLGYARFAPFPFGDGHGTKAIDAVLGTPVLWVETAHFRIGSTLPEYKLGGNADERKRVKADLARLSKRLGDIPARAKTLDPWLRLHLYAQRLEELYAEAADLLGAPSNVDGPYLGMREKYGVLLFRKASGFGRYAGHFLKRDEASALRAHYAEFDSMVYAVHAEALEGDFATDLALLTVVTYGVVQNLVDGYRGFRHVMPLWWQAGVAQSFARRIDPRCNVNGDNAAGRAARNKAWDWAPRVRGRVRNGAVPTWEAMLSWSAESQLPVAHHMVLWSRADYLLRERPEAVSAFQRALTEPPLGSWQRPPDDVFVSGQAAALVQATGLSLAELDAAWIRYVESEYPRK